MFTSALPVKESLINISRPVATAIVSAVYNVGDFMKEEISRLDLITGNYKNGLFWSKLNTNVHEAITSSGGRAPAIRVGFYEFVLVEHENYLLTFMREPRFRDVQAMVKSEGKLSYQNLLVQQFNSDLEADVAQTTMFPMHEYDEEDLLRQFNKIFGNTESSDEATRYYMMILFDVDGFFNLRKIKAVIVDSNFDIVEEQDWSHYIPVKETVIVEKVLDPSSPVNKPSRGITLKPKALERKLQQNESPPKNEE